MSREEDDANEFFERLLGRLPTDSPTPLPGVEALRDALQAQIATMRAAETATEADFDAEEKARMAELKQLLIARGLLGVPVASTPSRFVDRPPLLQRIRDALLGSGWHRPVALAASLVLGIMVIVKIALPPPAEESIVRGAATPVIVAPDPAAAAESLAAKLRSVGAEVISVQINAKEWSMNIDLPRTGNLAAVQKMLSDAGAQVAGPPPYEVSVKSER